MDSKYFVLDIFAGPGGLSEGFHKAGFEIVSSIENDSRAAATLKTRVLYRTLKSQGMISLYWDYVRGNITFDDLVDILPDIKYFIDLKVIQKTISHKSFASICNKVKTSMKHNGIKKVNVLLGGPPCQLYSLIGRANYSNRKDKFYRDPRRRFFESYLLFLKEFKPMIFVFENVPGIISSKYKRKHIFDILQDNFTECGYNLFLPKELKPDDHIIEPEDFIMNSTDFGIPQKRKRLILIGFRKDLANNLSDVHDLYKLINIYKKIHTPLTVRDAICDLPSVQPGEGNDRWFGLYNNNNNISSYARLMRKESEGIIHHRARTHMQKDLQRYHYFIKNTSSDEKQPNLNDLIRDEPELTPSHKNLKSFTDRFKVQLWDNPASTIMSHIAKDGHYYIHPDLNQCRSFTVREAARCQSFPDNFIFEGPRTEQFKQVGNAVPPLLSYVIAKAIKTKLSDID